MHSTVAATQFLGDLAARVSLIEQPLRGLENLRVQNRCCPSPPARLDERFDPPGTIPAQRSGHAALGHAETADDIELAAAPRIDELGGGELEHSSVSARVFADRMESEEIGPLVRVAVHAEHIADRGCTLGNKR